MRRRIIPSLVLVVILLGSLLAGATSTSAAREGSGEHVLRIEWNSYPDMLDPQRIESEANAAVAGLFFEGLTRIDDELNVAPGAAESWEFSPDGLTLTFHLHDGLAYGDGSPLTAENFRYTIERICDPRTESPWVSVLFVVVGCEAYFTSLDTGGGDVDATSLAGTSNPALDAARAKLGVRAVDGQTLEILLTEPAAYFPAAASMPVFFPAKRESIEAGGAEWWRDPANLVGNGPFRIERLGNDTDAPSQMVFAANDRYWGGRPKLDRIEYVMANEDRTAEQRLDAYRRGDIDMVWLAYEEFPIVEADPELSRGLTIVPRASTNHLGFTLNREPFQDKKVREAFAYGFDRAGFCREIQYDICTPTLSWIPPGVPGHIETDAFAFDPEKARQALAESSYGGPEGLPEITWYYWGGGAEGIASRKGAEWLAAQYRAVLGIEVTLVEITDDEWDALYDNPETRPQLIEWGWVQDYPDPQDWLSVYWTCDSIWATSRGGYCNPEFDALVARADAERDPATRLALYEEAERMLIDDVPTIFLSNWTDAVIVNPSVVGYTTTPIDYWPGWTTMQTIDIDQSE